MSIFPKSILILYLLTGRRLIHWVKCSNRYLHILIHVSAVKFKMYSFILQGIEYRRYILFISEKIKLAK